MKGQLIIGTGVLLAAIAGQATGAEGISVSTDTAERVPDAIAHPDLLAQHEIASRMITLLPADQRRAIVAAGGFGTEEMHSCEASDCAAKPSNIAPRALAEQLMNPELEARITEGQKNMFWAIVETLEKGVMPPALCFAPDTDREYAFAVNQLLELPFTLRFQQNNRWTRTATDGTGLTQGTPTTLTYSYIPDGTTVTDLNFGLGGGQSALFAWLNGIYGSPANWQAIFDQIFDRWSDLIGTTYVYEPNDDGVNTNTSAGVLGVRGDVRIGAFNFVNDGNGGVLAYNNFPQDGDMIFDAFDTFYNNTGGNSLRFRNVAAHEHGHGLGMLHVCPAVGTKLMEPFISTAYDGPQLDDILNGQRHYGDNFEPMSDDPFNAPEVGILGINDVASVTNVSIDDNSDQDYYAITLTDPAQVIINVAPSAATYDQGTQTQACNTGASTNYNAIHDLRLDIYDAAAPTVSLASVDATGFGGAEDLIFDAENAGDYVIRVSGSAANSIQLYNLAIGTLELPFLGPQIVATPPSSLDPGVAASFSVTINPREDNLNGAPQLFYRAGTSGSYQASDLVSTGGLTYTANLPAADCGDMPQFYIQANGQVAGSISLPSGGPANPFEAIVGDVVVSFADNFQTNQGWSVSGPVSGSGAGEWERAIPGGDGSRGDAPEDFDGSGFAFVTGNGGAGSNTDVDDGQTILTSPAVDLSGNPEAVVSYARWYHNSAGGAPNADIFTVQISDNNGSSWTNLEVVGPSVQSNGGWFEVSHRVADFVSTTAQVRIRFIAEDAGTGSVIEAAVDAVEFSEFVCEQPGGCSPADIAEPFDTLNFFDIAAYIGLYNAGDPAADLAAPFGSLNFFDISEYISLYNAGCP